MKITTIPYSDKGAFLKAKEKLIARDELAHSDSHLKLNGLEKKAALFLEQLKAESREFFLSKGLHPAATRIINYKDILTNNPLFRFLRRMPKGILQHIHSSTACDPNWIVEKAQAEENCYVYWLDDNQELKGTLKFFKNDQVPDGFVSASKVEKDDIYHLISLVSREDSSSLKIENELASCYERIRWFTAYEPIFEDYYTQAFLSLIKDHLQGAELRFDMQENLYDLKGNRFDANHMIYKLKAAHQGAMQVGRNEGFILKIILSTQRSENQMEILEYLQKTFQLKKSYPDIIAGYDISGNNNWPKNFRSYLDLTDNISNIRAMENEYNLTMPLYFHDNENFSSKDKGLYDAVLLECNRMGMSLNLFRFPELEKVIRDREIHVEIMPLSNQIKGYVPDLRVHPASGYINKGINCTISSGDPGFFGYSGVSPDFWAATIAWDLDLKEIKQLIVNSFASSSCEGNIEDIYSEKGLAYRHWSNLWDIYIENINS